MSRVSDEISSQFPWLCRYARALTGDARAGDGLALSAALTLREAPPRRPAWVRGALFRALSRLLAEQVDESALWMQARLLLCLEHFSPRQAARILGVTSRRLRELMDEAGAAQQADQDRTVLILDTEPLITLDIETELENWGYRVVGVPRTLDQAFSLVRRERPDVIILTSAIRFGNSCEPIRDAEELARICGSSLVLLTALPERFLSRERDEWAFILRKPFDHAAIGPIVSQALRARGLTSA